MVYKEITVTCQQDASNNYALKKAENLIKNSYKYSNISEDYDLIILKISESQSSKKFTIRIMVLN